MTRPVYTFRDESLAAALRARSPEPRRFRNGQKIRLIDELGGGLAEIVDAYSSPLGVWQVRLPTGNNIVLSERGFRPFTPTWKPGDVVVIEYGPHRVTYTYVRGREAWLVEDGRPQKPDAFMNAQYAAGRLRPVLQSGGEPFDSARLA